MIPRPIMSKIPGEPTTVRSEKYLKTLSNLDKIQLLEIKEREEKLLARKSQIARLPDKGQRIKDFYEKVLKELSQRDEVEKAVALFSDLNIASSGQSKLNTLEWTGKCPDEAAEVELLDSDDETVDPLALIAQSTAKTKVIVKKAVEQSLITQSDLDEIKSFSNDLEPHSVYLMEKSVDSVPVNDKFKPYKTTITDVHKPEKEKLRKQHKNWENTAATHPPIRNVATKMITLKDSVEMQTQYLINLKNMQQKQAEDRLSAKMARSTTITLPDEQLRKVSQFFKSYREIEEEIEEIELHDHPDIEGKRTECDDDEGVRDDEDEKGAGIINFTVYEH